MAKCPSAESDNLDVKVLPFMPLPPTPAIIFCGFSETCIAMRKEPFYEKLGFSVGATGMRLWIDL